MNDVDERLLKHKLMTGENLTAPEINRLIEFWQKLPPIDSCDTCRMLLQISRPINFDEEIIPTPTEISYLEFHRSYFKEGTHPETVSIEWALMTPKGKLRYKKLKRTSFLFTGEPSSRIGEPWNSAELERLSKILKDMAAMFDDEDMWRRDETLRGRGLRIGNYRIERL